MKMSDVFELPLAASDYVNDGFCDDCLRDVHGSRIAYDNEFKAAAHAINCHDGLVDAVEALLFYPDLADRKLIAELLSKAKGE